MTIPGYTDEQIAETIAIQDALEANAEDFADLMKLKGMTSDMPGYVEFAKNFARNMIRDQKLRQRIAS